jgi:integrase
MTGTTLAADPGLSLVLAQYAERLRRKRKSPHTLTGFATAATRYDRWLKAQGKTAEDASYADVEDYFDQLPLAASSKATHLKMIKAAYNDALRRGTIRANPAYDVEVEEPIAKEPRIIPTEVLREIRAGIHMQRDWIFFHLLAYTGMRRAEIATLRWDDGGENGSVVKLPDQTIRVLGKGNKLRTVPIHPVLQECLLHAGPHPGKWVVPSDGKKGVAIDTIQVMSKRMHPIYTPHDYRRTVATSLRRNGVDESVRNRILGWGPKDIFMRHYDHVADAELHRGILRLYADDPLG